MTNGKALLISALVLLGLSTAQAAEPAGQAGGLPTLDYRLGALESTVADQETAGAALQVTVDDLQIQLNGVQNDLATLEGRLPMFAVVDGDGTLRASRGVQSAGHSVDASGNPLRGAGQPAPLFPAPPVTIRPAECRAHGATAALGGRPSSSQLTSTVRCARSPAGRRRLVADDPAMRHADLGRHVLQPGGEVLAKTDGDRLTHMAG